MSPVVSLLQLYQTPVLDGVYASMARTRTGLEFSIDPVRHGGQRLGNGGPDPLEPAGHVSASIDNIQGLSLPLELRVVAVRRRYQLAIAKVPELQVEMDVLWLCTRKSRRGT